MQNAGIEFSVARCALGWLLVAATERGVCNVRFGDDPGELTRGLCAEFPFARPRANPQRLEPWLAALLEAAAGRTPRGAVPLDVRGSQFQRRVWDAIRAIPRGQTRSYGELARALGRPAAARAVASACAASPVALAVPCHRVVRAGADAGGYRWGAERKRALLESEKESELSLSFSGLASFHGPAGSDARHPRTPGT